MAWLLGVRLEWTRHGFQACFLGVGLTMDKTGDTGLAMGHIRMDTTGISGLVTRGRINYGHGRGLWHGYGSD